MVGFQGPSKNCFFWFFSKGVGGGVLKGLPFFLIVLGMSCCVFLLLVLKGFFNQMDWIVMVSRIFHPPLLSNIKLYGKASF